MESIIIDYVVFVGMVQQYRKSNFGEKTMFADEKELSLLNLNSRLAAFNENAIYTGQNIVVRVRQPHHTGWIAVRRLTTMRELERYVEEKEKDDDQ